VIGCSRHDGQKLRLPLCRLASTRTGSWEAGRPSPHGHLWGAGALSAVGHRCVALDLPGHGSSTASSPGEALLFMGRPLGRWTLY
jgi:pimeloyl-ACP methyl ester carboxylesterase